MKTCYLCDVSDFSKRPGSVRDNPALSVLECNRCGLAFLSSFDHITPGHYENSGMFNGEPIPANDWLKECYSDDERRFKFLIDRIIGKSVLDFGCGVGGFLLRSKNAVSYCSGIEPETRLQDHFSQSGLDVVIDLKNALQGTRRYDIITAFHVIEHLPDPADTLRMLCSLLNNHGELIVEIPNSDDALLTLFNCEEFSRFTYWSNHLYLFNPHTLSALVRKAGLTLRWMKQAQRYPLSNHLYWLRHGKPGGHRQWHFLNDTNLVEAYESALAAIGKCDTILAGIGPN